MAQLKSRIERDVTVVIESTSTDGEKGISLEKFQPWVKISLEIRGISHPSHIIETDAWGLVLDADFSYRIYLNGIFLPAAFANLKPYRFCYNFTRGKINRDRQILIDKSEEADAVRKIWEAAIEKYEEIVLPLYLNLLRNFPESPDVASADLLKNSTETLIWRRVLRDAGDTG